MRPMAKKCLVKGSAAFITFNIIIGSVYLAGHSSSVVNAI